MAAATLIHVSMKVAYKLIWLKKRLLKSSTKGAGVAVWYNGEILVVRHSYRPGWALPGGRSKKNEEPRATAAREVCEEVGIDLLPEELVLVNQSRSGHSLFEYQLRTPSEPQIDNREIIEARFLNPAAISEPDQMLSSYLRKAIGGGNRKPV